MTQICVDNGYGDTKVMTEKGYYKFNSKVQTAINNNGCVLQVDGYKYQIGIGQDDIGLNKSISQVHQLCLLKALAENAKDDEEINLFVDLPITHYYNLEYRNEFKESIPKTKTVLFNNTPKKINISNIEVCPQGLSALYAHDSIKYKNKLLGILDIGALTIDGCIVENLTPIKESKFSINLGTLILENKIKTALNQEFMLNIQNFEIPYIIKDGLPAIPTANSIINHEIEDYFHQLKREMMSQNWSIETLNILGIGGGALLLKDLLELNFNYTQSPNPIYDNVLGLWNIGRQI